MVLVEQVARERVSITADVKTIPSTLFQFLTHFMETPTAQSTRARGRGKSRGGLGKYLRARGRGHGGSGRPAEFGKRLVLEDEEQVEMDAEEAKEVYQKYSRRHLGTNADRYAEPEPELNSDGS
jgi:hypothetical protein